jgi:eukaryotic-like serine/threonine-protein kinase
MPLAKQAAGNLAVKPQIVGEYELGPLVGTGTVGEVYRARHRQTGQAAVVKFLRAETSTEPDVQRRFVREVTIAEKLDHPNIVRHYDCGLCDDEIYFAMELVECGTIKSVLKKRGALAWREAVACASQICEALEYAHQMGIIHRDLKPANLFLAADGRVKIGDFGLARDLNRGRLTLEGQTVGTCRYMSPEQITGDSELTGAVDLYALGCLIYEMLVGRPPFDGSTVIQIFEAHLYDEVTPPCKLVRDCPQELSQLVLLLLQKNPDDRPRSAADVQAALANILHGRPIRITSAEQKQSSRDPEPGQPPVATIRSLPGQNRQSTSPATLGTKSWLIVAAVLAAAALVGIVLATR